MSSGGSGLAVGRRAGGDRRMQDQYRRVVARSGRLARSSVAVNHASVYEDRGVLVL